MAKERNFLEEVMDSMGVEERIERGDVLKWDGSKADEVYRGSSKTRSRKRDVTKEVAESIGKLLKGR